MSIKFGINTKFIRMLFGLAILVFLLWLVDLRKLWEVLSELTWEAVFYLVLISIALIYVSAIKWGLFLESLGSRIPVFRLFRLYVVGYFVNLVLPSYLGGDAVRSWYIGKSVGQHEALAATILERYTGLVAMVSLGIVGSFLRPNIPWQSRAAISCVGFALVVATIFALSSSVLDLLERNAFLAKFVKHLRRIQESFHLAKKDHLLLAKAFGFSLIYHLLTVVNTCICAFAVSWHNPPFIDLIVVLPLILIIGALPLSPQGLGIQEGAFVFFLQSVGANPAQALGIALILRAKSYVIAIFGYFMWLLERRNRSRL